ncbi:hypothetical protein ASG43_05155 [Aureimonas sp. Leaf454]|uniref:UDP-glucose dehydrogenase family protein n=1 Tax=Aureimonas sp. Leaf454 TaxID=1736381 RepID=UPI0006F94CF7|nr:UDP-glucose/GDP-mannose dehydrogenase family protein [Aureimonas sp. Leaf454]KQT50676.1 hypothetical protein ASG43_05155 [Aureimonas sp. Leaf454]
MLKICVVGTGYVGLVTGTCLAEMGHDVLCVDTHAEKIARLSKGDIPIYEPGLDAIVADNVAAGRLAFSTDITSVLAWETLVLFFAIGTPTAADGPHADVGPLRNAVLQAARARAERGYGGFIVFVIKSTVPVGTCARLDAEVARWLPRESYAIVSNPEFLREGCAIEDFLAPDRIVLGSSSPHGLALMRRVYAPLTTRGYRLLAFDTVETSEMIKYASNVFLATKIGLVNEFALLCEKVGADVTDLAQGIGLDRRIGPAGLKAGPGFGGSCFPKDLRALVRIAEEAGGAMPIAEAVIASNERQKRAMVARVVERLGGDVRDLRIGVLGLSFKAGTDDVREAPAVTLIDELIKAGARVVAFDPVAMQAFGRIVPDIELAATAEDVFADAAAVVIVTEWPEFAALPFAELSSAMARPLVIDLRNHLDPAPLAALGYEYLGLGHAASRADLLVEVEMELDGRPERKAAIAAE